MMLSGLHVLMVCVVTATSQVPTVTWNGSVITGPVLIYHDEVLTDTPEPPYTVGDPNRPGALVCRTEIETTVAWFWPHDNFVLVPGSNRGFHQVRTPNNSISLLSRTTNYMASTATGSNRNGLWTCRLREEWIPIGLFNRREGFGAITGNPEVTLLHSSAPLNPQAFVLAANTSGGPPTSYIWMRDNNEISGDNEDFSISIAVFNKSDVASYENSRYRSTLTVTERRQGMYTYQYSATNRATTGNRTGTFTVQVLAGPTEVVVEEAGFQSVRISWNAPSTQTPDEDYSLLFDSSEGNTTTLTATSSPSTVFLQPGVYSLLIVAASQNVTYEIPSPVNFTILGHSLPELTAAELTATSVVVSWSQPALSLPVAEYTVSVRHAAGSGLCGFTEDTRPEQNMSTNATSHAFNGLQEFSNYTATVMARFTEFSIITTRSSSYNFTTLSASPSGLPLDVNIISVTSRSIEATWDAVACIERNGIITGYRVEVQEQSGHKVIDEIVENKAFTATELTPYTDYIFRVAGVNSNGTGPFSNITTSTDEDTPGAVSALVGKPTLTSIELSWGHPEEPNGVIIDYEVNYSINGTYYNASGFALEYTISSLQPGTTVSQISVVAYTLLGPGIVAMSDDVTTLHEPPMVLNVMVEMISAESVRVTWDRVDLPEISAYIVYYGVIGSTRQDTSSVPSSSQSSTINGLIPGEVYTFQVAAIADFSQSNLEGKKSVVSGASLVTLKAEGRAYVRDIAITAVITCLLTFTLTLLGCIFGVLPLYNKYFARKPVTFMFEEKPSEDLTKSLEPGEYDVLRVQRKPSAGAAEHLEVIAQTAAGTISESQNNEKAGIMDTAFAKNEEMTRSGIVATEDSNATRRGYANLSITRLHEAGVEPHTFEASIIAREDDECYDIPTMRFHGEVETNFTKESYDVPTARGINKTREYLKKKNEAELQKSQANTSQQAWEALPPRTRKRMMREPMKAVDMAANDSQRRMLSVSQEKPVAKARSRERLNKSQDNINIL